jgi:hypothetical protein
MTRRLLSWFLALMLLMSGIGGTHRHFSPGGESGSDAQPDSMVRVFVWFDAGHQTAHEQDGDVDIEAPVKVAGKTPLYKWLVAVAACVLVIILVPPAVAWLRALPHPSPPRPRPRPYLQPPGQAPPLRA